MTSVGLPDFALSQGYGVILTYLAARLLIAFGGIRGRCMSVSYIVAGEVMSAILAFGGQWEPTHGWREVLAVGVVMGLAASGVHAIERAHSTDGALLTRGKE